MTIKRPVGGWNAQGLATHPGEVLQEEFLKPMGISRHKLALDTHMPATRERSSEGGGPFRRTPPCGWRGTSAPARSSG